MPEETPKKKKKAEAKKPSAPKKAKKTKSFTVSDRTWDRATKESGHKKCYLCSDKTGKYSILGFFVLSFKKHQPIELVGKSLPSDLGINNLLEKSSTGTLEEEILALNNRSDESSQVATDGEQKILIESNFKDIGYTIEWSK